MEYSNFSSSLKKFQISYVDYITHVDEVQEAVQTELDGPGKLLGYRAMNLKLRTEHGIRVPRRCVLDRFFCENFLCWIN